MTTRLSSLIDDIEACFDSLSLTTSGPDELRQKLAALRKAVALPADTAVAEIVERARRAVDLGTRTGSRGKHPTNIYNVADDLLTALEAENAARVKAEKLRDERWRDWRKIIDAVIGDRPMCRDCADEDGTCPNRNGLPCDPTNEVVERFTRLSSRAEAAERDNAQLRKALKPFAEAGGMVPIGHGPDIEPVGDDEPVTMMVCGYSVGNVTAADLDRAYTLLKENPHD